MYVVHSYFLILALTTLILTLLINLDPNYLIVHIAIAEKSLSSFSPRTTTYSNDPSGSGGPPNNTSSKLAPPTSFRFEQQPSPPALTDEQGEQIDKSINETLVSPNVPLSNETIMGPNLSSSRTSLNNTNGKSSMLQTPSPLANSNNNSKNILQSIDIIATSENDNNIRSELAKSKENSIPIKLVINKTVTPSSLPSMTDEPAVASNGSIVFYTGNKYAASSIDNGSTWRYIDPKNDPMPICCDQDTMYDPQRNMFIWYRQAENDRRYLGENFFALGISSDLKNWTFYAVRPTDIDGTWTKQWFDYPQLALGNKYLYITTNVQRTETLGFKHSLHTVIIRISLDDLKRGVQPEFNYFQDSSGAKSFVPVQGATDVMYWGAHLSNNLTRIYQWNESLPWTSITYYDRNIPAWSVIKGGNGKCPTGPNNSSNWCKRADSFLNMQGWVSRNIVGFIWNAAQGGKSTHNASFSWPYINAALFNITDNMAYIGRPYIWSPTFAWLYGYVMPAKNGDLGIIAFFGGGSKHPSLAAGIHHADSHKFWQMMPIINGTNVPDKEKWGDYIRVRNYANSSNLWAGSGFTLQNGNSEKFIEPRYFVFGASDSANNNTTSNDVSSITNVTSTSQINLSNKSCSGLSGLYDVTLSDSAMQNPNMTKSALNTLTQKINRSGLQVTSVLENIGILQIKSQNQQLLNRTIGDLRRDPLIASVEPTICVGINQLGS